MSDIDAIAAGFLAAQIANEPYAAPSISAALSLEDAHAVQRAFNSSRGGIDELAGYKSAANAEALQRALGLSGPITGTLFSNGERAAGSRIRREAYRTLLIESELGFRAARRFIAPV